MLLLLRVPLSLPLAQALSVPLPLPLPDVLGESVPVTLPEVHTVTLPQALGLPLREGEDEVERERVAVTVAL